MSSIQPALRVIGLCAAWCDTCGSFRATFDRLAVARPDTEFVWLDIEDDADLVGDIDIEDFPTLAIYADGRLVHFGVTLPQPGLVARLIDSMGGASPTTPGPDALTTLPRRLSRRG